MPKTYLVTDLFHNNYEAMLPKQLAELAVVRRTWVALHERVTSLKPDQEQVEEDKSLLQAYGLASIAVLRALRKKPLLVDKINVGQAVDCLNELATTPIAGNKLFLHSGWNFFLKNPGQPEEFFHNRTFDHFVHADNNFSLLKNNHTKEQLAKVVACLYDKEQYLFNADTLSIRAQEIAENWSLWELDLVVETYANVREWIMARCKNLFNSPPPSPETEVKAGSQSTGPMWVELKQRTAELRITWKDPRGKETNYVGHARYLEVLDHLESLSKRNHAA